MATTKQNEGGLSRRDFIKKTTAATAVASISLAPHSPVDRRLAAEWEVTGDQLRLLWAEIYPKIVAFSWKDAAFRQNFTTKEPGFRAAAVSAVADILGYVFQWPANLPINILAEEDRRTQFYIFPDGIWLPWPVSPYPPDLAPPEPLESEYVLRGGFLPKSARSYSPKEDALVSAIEAGLEGINAFEFEGGSAVPMPGETALTGQAVFALLDQLSRIVPLTMFNNQVKQEYSGTPLNVITDVSLPPGLDLVVENGNEDLRIEPVTVTQPDDSILRLTLPLPAGLPDDRDRVFKELMLGYASNPMYSNCY